jgi:hypothetical protein
MKRWDVKNEVYVENKKIDDFLNEIIAISKKHGLSIYDDEQNGIVITKYDDEYSEYLLDANDATNW